VAGDLMVDQRRPQFLFRHARDRLVYRAGEDASLSSDLRAELSASEWFVR
jgi:hypothetical protein